MNRLTRIIFSVFLILTQLRMIPVSADTDAAPYCTALLEAQTGMLLRGEQSDKIVPAGSQTKLMTVLLTAETVAAGRLTPETEVSVPPSAEGMSGATVWLRAGEHMNVTDLLKAVIIGNANDAALTLACAVSGSEAEFVRDMNGEAFSLGMRSTRFTDCTGISPENITTAYELGLLSRALLSHAWLLPVFSTWRDFLRGDATELVNENRLTRTFEGILGMKAGHGDASGYTLTAAAEQSGMRCIAVVLGCEDPDERFSVGKRLLAAGFSEYTVTTPDFSAEFLRPVTVRRGITAAVIAETAALHAAAVPKDTEFSCIVCLPRYLEAPVRQGDLLGEAAFYCGDTLLYEAPLTAAEDVPRRTLKETLRMLLGNLFK